MLVVIIYPSIELQFSSEDACQRWIIHEDLKRTNVIIFQFEIPIEYKRSKQELQIAVN